MIPEGTNLKHIGAAVVAVVGFLAGGAALGFTVEPQSTTDLRIEHAATLVRLEEAEGRLSRMGERMDKVQRDLDHLGKACQAPAARQTIERARSLATPEPGEP